MKFEFLMPKECYSFWSWLYLEWNYPKHSSLMSDPERIVGFRLCGFSFEWEYTRK